MVHFSVSYHKVDLDLTKENAYLKVLAKACKKAQANCALVGAWAAIAHGHIRATHDIDAIIGKGDLWKLDNELRLQGFVLKKNPRLGKHEFILHPQPGSKYEIDIYDQELNGLSVSHLLSRARYHPVTEDIEMKVISPEDLILTKRQGRPTDLEDILIILVRQEDTIDWNYLQKMSANLDLDLKKLLRRSLTHLRKPLTGGNPQKIRKRLTRLIDDL